MNRNHRQYEPPLLCHDSFTLPLWGGRRIRARRKLKPQGYIGLVVILFLTLRAFLGNKTVKTRHLQKMSLSQYPTLDYPLAHAKLVLLYFGSSDSDETRLLRNCFLRDERLLPLEGLGLQLSGKYDMAIVYVGSDDEVGSGNEVGWTEWITVLSPMEKIALKMRFQIALTAQERKLIPGAQPLQQIMESNRVREFSEPSLFVIDSESHGVMTPMGLIDLKEKRSDALQGWLQFQSAIRNLDPSVWADLEYGYETEQFHWKSTKIV